MNKICHPLSWVFASILIPAAPLSQATEPSLCKSDEVTIFSCELKNTKFVSICAARHSTHDYVDYRFGTKAKLEFTYSANTDVPTINFTAVKFFTPTIPTT